MTYKKEEELHTRIQNGDTKAEEELFSKFNERILWIIQTRFRYRHQDWENLSQDSWIAILESLRKGKFNPKKGGSLKNYIGGIVRNICRNHSKDIDKHKNDVSPGDTIPDPNKTDRDMIEEERRKIIRDSISKLKDIHQKVLRLRFFEGNSIEEIAELLKMTPAKVSELKFQALKQLKKYFKRKNYFSIFFSLFPMVV